MTTVYGSGYVTAAFIWKFQIIIGYCQIPLACWAMSGKACSPFWWAAERMPTEKQRVEKIERRKREQEEEAASRKTRGLAVARSGRIGALIEEFRYFVSPFQTPAFRWLWIQAFVGTIGGTIQGSLTFYWFQDCFPDGYYLFKWQLAKDVQSAVAINGMVGAVVNSAVSWSGNYWRERIGGRQICLGFGPWAATGIIGFACPFTYVIFSYDFLSYDSKYLFTVVLFWTVSTPGNIHVNRIFNLPLCLGPFMAYTLLGVGMEQCLRRLRKRRWWRARHRRAASRCEHWACEQPRPRLELTRLCRADSERVSADVSRWSNQVGKSTSNLPL